MQTHGCMHAQSCKYVGKGVQMTRTHVRTRIKDIAEVIELNRFIKIKTLLKKYHIAGNF